METINYLLVGLLPIICAALISTFVTYYLLYQTSVIKDISRIYNYYKSCKRNDTCYSYEELCQYIKTEYYPIENAKALEMIFTPEHKDIIINNYFSQKHFNPIFDYSKMRWELIRLHAKPLAKIVYKDKKNIVENVISTVNKLDTKNKLGKVEVFIYLILTENKVLSNRDKNTFVDVFAEQFPQKNIKRKRFDDVLNDYHKMEKLKKKKSPQNDKEEDDDTKLYNYLSEKILQIPELAGSSNS